MEKLFLTLTLIATAAYPALANMDHSSHSKPMAKMEMSSGPVLATIDGFDVSFDFTTHKEYQDMMKGMKMESMKAEKGTTHHVAVTIRKDGSRIEDAVVNLKVTGPDKKEEARALAYNPDMMLQYVGHFNMRQKGKYQLLITFEAGKEKHQGMVNYEVK